MIKLDGVTKTFRTKNVITHALRDVNLDVSEGEFIAIMGPSGCGKSSLLNVCGLLTLPNTGGIFYGGRSVPLNRKASLTRVRDAFNGYIFQSYNLLPKYSVLQNIMLPLKYRGIDKREAEKRARQSLSEVDLAGRTDHMPSQLSGGQQQRVAIARAIALKPKILFADEPTGNLDHENASIILDQLDRLNSNGMSIFMVTHSEENSKRADRIIHMSEGQIMGEDRRKFS